MANNFVPGEGPTLPYSSYPIIIADDTGGNAMTFDGLQEPAVLPEFTYQRHVKVTRTRPGENHPGYRIFGSFGAIDNYKDLKLELPIVGPDQYAQLLGYFNARPGVFSVTIDAGPGGVRNIYFCMFKDNGLQPKNYMFNQRLFTGLSLDLYIINLTNSVSFS